MANEHYRRPIWNTMSEDGAKKLARTIEGYWATRGRSDVKTRIEEHVYRSDAAHRVSVFCVRSNLYNGLPPVLAA